MKKIGDVFSALADMGHSAAVDGLGLFYADIGRNTGHTSQVLREYGFSDEELRNGGYQARIHPDDVTAYLESWRRVNEGWEDELFCEYRVLAGDGAWRWIETHAVVLDRAPDNSWNIIVGVDRAIDARRRSYEALERRYRDARRKLYVVEKLSNNDLVLRSDRDLSDSLCDAAKQLSDILAFDRIALFVTRGNGTAKNGIKWHRVWSSHPKAPSNDELLAAPFHTVQHEHHPMIVDRTAGEGPYASLIVIPIRIDGVLIAVMSVECAAENAYRSEDIYPVEAFSRIVGILLGNQRFIERKVSYLKKDTLTGFFTRAALENDAPRLWSEYSSLYAANAVAMIDIDHFKRINDTYGHQAGDAIIRRVADAILRSLRRDDLIIRYGGEEFLVILPNADRVAAEQIMNRLRAECESLHFFEGSETVTVSIGVAPATRESQRTLEDNIALADSALYEAKRSGRNRVTVFLSKDQSFATVRNSAS
ncbi:MAG: diguanylate cyclase [Spirochaetaceae bacterium]